MDLALRMKRIHQNPFPLAPLHGFTDTLYRRLMRRLGCGFVVSEFVPAADIHNRSRKILAKIRYHEEERPFGIQIYGNKTEDLVRAACTVEQLGADFVDFNFGCPVKTIVSKGKGAAWLTKPQEIGALIKKVKAEVHIPVSMKIRTGFESENVFEVLRAAEDAGIDWVIVHGRTSRQGYRGEINWNLLAEVKNQARVPIIANGEVNSSDAARKALEMARFDGLMIGRASLLDPRIFLKLRRDILGEPLKIPTLYACFEMLDELAREVHPQDHAFTLARLVVHWAVGYPGARDFRIKMFRLLNERKWEELRTSAREHLIQCEAEDVTRSPVHNFMMAGHG